MKNTPPSIGERASHLGEGYGEEYYANVIWAVVPLKEIRSLNALIDVIETGRMADSTLAEFGSAALDRVVAVLNSGDIAKRQGASYALAQMLDPKNASKVSDPASRAKIRDALIRAARDESLWVRLAGIEGLRKLDEPEIIRFLQDLATGDPDEIVRNAAKEALKKSRYGPPRSGLPAPRWEWAPRDGRALRG